MGMHAMLLPRFFQAQDTLTMARLFFTLTGLLGFLAVALGAFGAHGLRTRLGDLDDFAQRLSWWEKAAHYHLTHALALAIAGVLVAKGCGRPAVVAGWCFITGIALFSGSLYTMTLTGTRALGAVTPLGGLFLLAGWLALTGAARALPS